MINASTFSFFGKEICTGRTNVCIMFSVYDPGNIRIVCKVGVVMYRFYRKLVTGGSVMMALACAGLSADCELPFAVGSMVYAEEFEVVPDERSTEDPGISVVADSGDTAAVSEDVFAIDGLIEVVEEHSDSSGGSGKEKGSGKDKKTKKWKFRTYADDVYGNRKQFERKGFNTKKEAQQAEIDFKMSDKSDKSKITFNDLWVEYRSSKELQLKAQSFRSVESRFKNHILPYLKLISFQ